VITSGQIKAARALLGITATKLAELSAVAYTTVVRLESSSGVPSSQVKTLDAVQKALEKASIRVTCVCCDRIVSKNRLLAHMKTDLCKRTQQTENYINDRLNNKPT
jgi:predicted transcriptional regulator